MGSAKSYSHPFSSLPGISGDGGAPSWDADWSGSPAVDSASSLFIPSHTGDEQAILDTQSHFLVPGAEADQLDGDSLYCDITAVVQRHLAHVHQTAHPSASIAQLRRVRTMLDKWLFEKLMELATKGFRAHETDSTDKQITTPSPPRLSNSDMLLVQDVPEEPLTSAKTGTRLTEPILLPCPIPGCRKSSKNSYMWKRHQSTHFPPWKCMPGNTHIINGSCGICGQPDTSDFHLASHQKIEFCLVKPQSKRSFRGKDKLCDHMRFHLGLEILSPIQLATRNNLIEAWQCPNDQSLEALWCGFCREYCQTWAERQEHVLGHLLKGDSIGAWQEFL